MPTVGDWVAITARIIEIHPNNVDYAVELFSKTDQYKCWVRRDLCQLTDKPIPDQPDEGSVALLDGVAHQRLGDGFWYPAGNVGRDHGISWATLQGLGDVEVIHHA